MTYAIIYVLIHQIIFRFYLLKYSFFSSTHVLISSIDVVFILSIENTIISSSETTKVFGVKIDDKLNFTEHISDVCTKAARQLNILQRLKKVLDYKSRMAMYKSFMMSNFNCYPIVWMFTCKTYLGRIDNIWKRALRFVLDDDESSYHDLLIQCGVSGIKIMTLRLLAIQVFKCVNKLNPECWTEMLTIKKCPCDLRNTSNLERPKSNTTKYRLTCKSLWNCGAKI